MKHRMCLYSGWPRRQLPPSRSWFTSWLDGSSAIQSSEAEALKLIYADMTSL